MMEEHRPEWYNEARKKSFGNERFTMRHADRVIRRIQEEEKRAKHRTRRISIKVLAVASFMVLLGVGVLFLNGRFPGNPLNSPVQTEVSTHFTQAELQRNAVQTMQSLLGKSYPLDQQVRLEEKRQMFYSYHTGENSAYIWINYDTGELEQAKMSAILTASEIDEEMKARAEEIMAQLGYPKDSTYNVLRYVEYDATQPSDVKIENNFRAEKWFIGFVNDQFDYASATLEATAVAEDVRQVGDEALKLLRGDGGDRGDELSLAFRSFGNDYDTLTLHYGSEVSVTLHTATKRIKQISDMKLRASDKTDAKALTRLDRELSIIDGDPLREKAGPLLANIYGITDLKEYNLLKKDQEPGNLTFSKPGSPEITIYYDSDLTIWKVIEASPVSQS